MQDPGRARERAARLLRMPGLQVHSLTTELLEAAGSLGTESFLLGADALYAALANQVDGDLVTWDAELVQRAAAQTPDA